MSLTHGGRRFVNGTCLATENELRESRPLVSIITVTYNCAEPLRKTIDSVLSQEASNYEYIVIDGGSSDNSVQVLNEYGDKIDYWVSEPDGGIYQAMNKGAAVARGEFIHFLNAGDTYARDNVLLQVFEFQKKTGKPFISCSIDYIGATGQVTELKMIDNRVDTIPHPGLFVQSTRYKQLPFNTKYRFAADLDWFLKNVNAADVGRCEVISTVFPSGGAGGSPACLQETVHIYLKNGKILRAGYCFLKLIKSILSKNKTPLDGQ